MKQEDTIIRFLILVLAVCCLGMMYHLSESIDTFNAQNVRNTPEIQTTEAMSSADETEAFYIANPNTKKFHRMNCAEIKKMNPDHITIAASREALEEQGFKGCKKCNP